MKPIAASNHPRQPRRAPLSPDSRASRVGTNFGAMRKTKSRKEISRAWVRSHKKAGGENDGGELQEDVVL